MRIQYAVHLFISLGIAWNASAAEEGLLKSEKERISYALGMNLGRQHKTNQIEINAETFTAGFRDSLSGIRSKLTDKQETEAMFGLARESRARRGIRSGLDEAKPLTEEERLKLKDNWSYHMGTRFGWLYKTNQIDINPDVMAVGLRDILSGSKPALTDEQASDVGKALREEVQTKTAERIKLEREKNKAFLEENKKRSGVITTASGLQYRILTNGTGLKPSSNDTVSVQYRGTRIDGAEFDSTFGKGPMELLIEGIIPGWAQALLMMPVGSKWELFLPGQLALTPPEKGPPGEAGGGLVFALDNAIRRPAKRSSRD